MSTITREKSRARDERSETTTTTPRSERTEESRRRATALHGAANDAIRQALSRNSEEFMSGIVQQGGQ